MQRLIPVLATLAISTGAAAEARKPSRPPPPPPAPVDVGAELGAAIRARSATRVAKLLGETVQSYGIWFSDAACAKQFGTPGVVSGTDLQAFARCLAQLKLQATTRQPAADNAILSYEPGIELEIQHLGGRVRWLGYQYQTAADRGRPTLTAQAFEALRRSGKTNLDDAVASKLEPLLERAKLGSISAWMKLCIDDEGSLDQVTLRDSDAPSGLSGKVSLAFEVAMRSWRFLPFKSQGKAIPVCTMALLTYPAARAPLVETLPPALQPGFSIDKAGEPGKAKQGDEDDDEDGVEGGVEGGVVGGVVGGAPPPPPPPPPPPGPPPQVVPPTVLEATRVTGDKNIEPDAVTKTEISRSGKEKLVGSFKLCIDTQGAVATVNQLKSTGFTAYDSKILREMKQWSYKPYSVNGKAVPVCTAVTFIYSQPLPPPPAKKP